MAYYQPLCLRPSSITSCRLDLNRDIHQYQVYLVFPLYRKLFRKEGFRGICEGYPADDRHSLAQGGLSQPCRNHSERAVPEER